MGMTFPDLDEVLALLCEVASVDSIDADRPIADVDIESIDVLEWLYVLEDRYSITLGEAQVEQLNAAMSIREIYEKVQTLALAASEVAPAP